MQDHAETSLNPGISVGVAYMAALVAYKGTVNPALALGQAFVRSRCDPRLKNLYSSFSKLYIKVFKCLDLLAGPCAGAGRHLRGSMSGESERFIIFLVCAMQYPSPRLVINCQLHQMFLQLLLSGIHLQ